MTDFWNNIDIAGLSLRVWCPGETGKWFVVYAPYYTEKKGDRIIKIPLAPSWFDRVTYQADGTTAYSTWLEAFAARVELEPDADEKATLEKVLHSFVG